MATKGVKITDPIYQDDGTVKIVIDPLIWARKTLDRWNYRNMSAISGKDFYELGQIACKLQTYIENFKINGEIVNEDADDND